MSKRTLQITIAEDGTVSVKVAGIAGASCIGATKFLEDAVGTVASQEPHDEYYQTEVSATVEHGS